MFRQSLLFLFVPIASSSGQGFLGMVAWVCFCWAVLPRYLTQGVTHLVVTQKVNQEGQQESSLAEQALQGEMSQSHP